MPAITVRDMGTKRPDPIRLRRVLEETGTLVEAAVELGVSRPTLYRWMRAAGVTDFHRRVRVPTHTGDLPGDGSAA